jgi:hypothetical protein
MPEACPALYRHSQDTPRHPRGGLHAWRGRVCVGGGRYSMGGQSIAPGALYLDLRTMNRTVWRAPKQMQNGGQVLPFSPDPRNPSPHLPPPAH